MKSRLRPRQWKRLYETEAPISLAGTGAFVDSEATLHSPPRQQVAEREAKPAVTASCRPLRSSRHHEDDAGLVGLLLDEETGVSARHDPRGMPAKGGRHHAERSGGLKGRPSERHIWYCQQSQNYMWCISPSPMPLVRSPGGLGGLNRPTTGGWWSADAAPSS